MGLRDTVVHGAEVTQGVRQLAIPRSRPQRGGKHRQHIHAARFECGQQRVDEAGIPAHPVGAVEDDADAGALRIGQRLPVSQAGAWRQVRVVDAVVRQRKRRLEAEAGQQQMVGQEAQQLRQVGAAAGAEVLQGHVQHVGTHGGHCRQFGIGFAGAADDDQVPPLAARVLDQVGKSGHAAQAAQHPHHDHARRAQFAVQQLRQRGLFPERLQVHTHDRAEAFGHLRLRLVQHGQVVGGVGQQRKL